MHTLIVSIQVIPSCIPDFIEITKYNAQNSRKEPGVVRFDFFQDVNHPESFRLVEVYHQKEDQGAHSQTEHYLKWRDAVAPMMAEDRSRVVLKNIDPDDANWY